MGTDLISVMVLHVKLLCLSLSTTCKFIEHMSLDGI